jgi:uncharacterized protein (TIGR02246 family)
LRCTGKEIKMSAKLSRLSSTLRFESVEIMTVSMIAINILIVTFSNMAVAQTDGDSAAVYEQIETYQSAWNTHDATALAVFFKEDADFIMGNQPLIRGREGIQNWWRNYFNRQEPERRLSIMVNSVRIITSDVALVNVTTTTGGQDMQGEKILKRKARGTWVLHRQKGGWLIIAMRGMPTEKDRIIRESY